MSHQTSLPSNLPKWTENARPQIVPYLNSLVGRYNGILRSEYYGSFDLDGYVNDAKIFDPSKFSDKTQMQDHYAFPNVQPKTMKDLSKHLDIARVHEPNEIPRLYSKVYSDQKNY